MAAAPGVLTPPLHSMAISFQTPSSTINRASAMPPKSKEELQAVGRRKLEKFRNKKAAPRPKQSLPQTNEQINESNGDFYSVIPEHSSSQDVVPTNNDQDVIPSNDSQAEVGDANQIVFTEKSVPVAVSGTKTSPPADSFDSVVHSSVNPPLSSSDGYISEHKLFEFEETVKQSSLEALERPQAGAVERPQAARSTNPSHFGSRAESDFSISFPAPEAPLPDSTTSKKMIEINSNGGDTSLKPSNSLPILHEGIAFEAPFSSRRDDFSALEQHIEDLTQEKFSLQRGLDKARALVESLSQVNSALTEDYNQQGAKVNELKDELARCQGKFRSQEAMLKNLKAERDKAQQESTLATERSRSFAAETIVLEEKVLKTRSQELKLQKEVEFLRAEIESSRRQISSIEKDRSNAISMNDALQEEKKLLLSRIREAAADKPSPSIAPPTKEDASTSTDDLTLDQESSSSALPTEQENPVNYPTSVPAEHLGIIESIDALVIELGQEKNEMLMALRNETNLITQLKTENAELSQRLERQTQQLELAFSQNMARAGTLVSPTVSQTTEEMEYIDEGDEVVDRVLGWIMRLFPGGGSSKRGGSKQL